MKVENSNAKVADEQKPDDYVEKLVAKEKVNPADKDELPEALAGFIAGKKLKNQSDEQVQKSFESITDQLGPSTDDSEMEIIQTFFMAMVDMLKDEKEEAAY